MQMEFCNVFARKAVVVDNQNTLLLGLDGFPAKILPMDTNNPVPNS
jgi:hypothetical protein